MLRFDAKKTDLGLTKPVILQPNRSMEVYYDAEIVKKSGVDMDKYFVEEENGKTYTM